MLARWLDFLQIESYVTCGRNMSFPASPGAPLGSTRGRVWQKAFGIWSPGWWGARRVGVAAGKTCTSLSGEQPLGAAPETWALPAGGWRGHSVGGHQQVPGLSVALNISPLPLHGKDVA